ncbi:Protein prenyltransferase alpha subunit repeat-containing protein 1 [Mortierella sp. GBA30]|nr:Protein prenyltransferase alpha subunit repeat-containing protein 1 [Mortierella sp. GBA30]
MFKDHETIPLDPSIVDVHLKACHLAAERYPKCYYAWSMRHWLVEHLGRHWWKASLMLSSSNSINSKRRRDDEGFFSELELDCMRPLEQELERMRAYMQRNVSDHSTQQHLQQCMIQLSGQWIVQRMVYDPVTSSSSAPEIVLQWTRGELARRQRARRDQNRRDRSSLGRKYQSAIKSIVRVRRTQIVTSEVDSSGKESPRASFPWVVKMWLEELERTRDMIRTYPGHESLWYHLRFVYYGLRWLDCETEGLEGLQDESVKSGEHEDYGVDDFVTQDTEAEFVVQVLSRSRPTECDADVDAMEEQGRCGKKYLDWVGSLSVEADRESN